MTSYADTTASRWRGRGSSEAVGQGGRASKDGLRTTGAAGGGPATWLHISNPTARESLPGRGYGLHYVPWRRGRRVMCFGIDFEKCSLFTIFSGGGENLGVGDAANYESICDRLIYI